MSVKVRKVEYKNMFLNLDVFYDIYTKDDF